MNRRVGAVCAGALLMGALAAPAQAQVNYYTQGWFTSATWASCNGAAPPVGAPTGSTCTTPWYTLDYTAKAPNPGLIGSGSVVSLGNFGLTVTGDGTVTPGSVMFTLAIQQTDPTTGTGTLAGSITGTVMMDDDYSTLMWIPSANTVTIGGTTYDFIFNDRGPAANRGYAIAVNNARTPTSIQAIVSTSSVPEPASLVLVATGLLGMAGVARRRKMDRSLHDNEPAPR